jgi:quercetin dioxygenase-like cupin family protein
MSAARVIKADELPGSEVASRFEGFEHDAQVSFFLSRNPAGSGPRLHRHPYEETFIVREGTVRFTVGDDTIEATAGDIIVVPAGTPHKFVNAGSAPMRQISIHPVARMEQEWLE